MKVEYFSDPKVWLIKAEGKLSDESLKKLTDQFVHDLRPARRGERVVVIGNVEHTKPKAIGNQEFNVDIDTTNAQRTLKRLAGAVNSIQQKKHVPHVCIEFDDIKDVPTVYIDGKDVTNVGRGGLQELHLNWLTNTEYEKPKSYRIQVIDEDGQHVFSNQNKYEIQ